MCKRGNTVQVEIDGVNRDVDSCIAPLVRALNAAGLRTVASCCGHGNQPANIALADGREVVLMPDWKTARRVEKLFSPIAGHKWRGERCKCCGYDQRMAWSVTDKLWHDVVPEVFLEEVLCLECFLRLADDAKVPIRTKDFRHLSAVALDEEDGGPGSIERPVFIE